MDDEILERLACVEHIQWQEWAESVCGDIEVLLEIIKDNVDLNDLDSSRLEVIERNAQRVENWPKLMVDYSKLSEEMKEKIYGAYAYLSDMTNSASYIEEKYTAEDTYNFLLSDDNSVFSVCLYFQLFAYFLALATIASSGLTLLNELICSLKLAISLSLSLLDLIILST